MQVIADPASWVEPDQLGAHRPYRATYAETPLLGPTFELLLRARHQRGSLAIDIGIPGSLCRDDALKVYELAYFGTGDVLELGSGGGLATAVLSLAIAESGRFARLVSVDLDSRLAVDTRWQPLSSSFLQRVTFRRGEVVAVCRELVRNWDDFGLVVVHHSHEYADVRSVCELLPFLVQPGGFALFRDMNDRRNRGGAHNEYGVYAAVTDGLPMPPFAFYGIAGSTGLYRWEAPTA